MSQQWCDERHHLPEGARWRGLVWNLDAKFVFGLKQKFDDRQRIESQIFQRRIRLQLVFRDVKSFSEKFNQLCLRIRRHQEFFLAFLLCCRRTS